MTLTEDHRLLEKAAKAAGRGEVKSYDPDGTTIWTATGKWPESGERWNPLKDDGDALRLAFLPTNTNKRTCSHTAPRREECLLYSRGGFWGGGVGFFVLFWCKKAQPQCIPVILK